MCIYMMEDSTGLKAMQEPLSVAFISCLFGRKLMKLKGMLFLNWQLVWMWECVAVCLAVLDWLQLDFYTMTAGWLYLTKYWWLIDLCMKPCIWVIIEGNYIYFTSIYFVYFTSIYFVYFAIIFRSLLSPSASAVLFVLCKSASWALLTTAYLLHKCEHVSI